VLPPSGEAVSAARGRRGRDETKRRTALVTARQLFKARRGDAAGRGKREEGTGNGDRSGSPEEERRVIKMKRNKGEGGRGGEGKKRKKKVAEAEERKRNSVTPLTARLSSALSLLRANVASVTSVASAFESRGGTRGEKSREGRAAVELFHRRVQLCSPTLSARCAA